MQKEGEELIKLISAVIEEVFEGQLLSAVLTRYGIPRSKFYKAITDYPSLNSYYLLSQQSRGELYVDEIVNIADTEIDPQRARVQIDARKWYASKVIPKKYGDRLDLNVSGSIDIASALAAAKARALPARYRSLDDQDELPDNTNEIEQPHTDTQSVLPDVDEEWQPTIEEILGDDPNKKTG